MLKIGEFPKLSRISVRMLRHYDEIGLLKLAETDRFTEYRYYREDQLPAAGRIKALREMGFSLADITGILAVWEDRDRLERFFSARKRELEALLQDTERKLTLLDAARTRLGKEESMKYDVTVKSIPERYAATVRLTVPRYEDEGRLWGILMQETVRMALKEADPCLCAVTFLDGEYKEENVELMVWKTVKGSYPDTEHVRFCTLPAETAACCTFKGSYALITEVYAAVVQWIEANGYEPAGPMFNIYHVSPHETQDPEAFVTEVCWPVKIREDGRHPKDGEAKGMAFDFRKEYREFYMPGTRPGIVTVPRMNYIAVRGQGDPNREDGAYRQSIPLLYGIAYTLKMSGKGDHRIRGFFDFAVPPLEGFWRQEGGTGFDPARKEELCWISAIRLPDFVTGEEFRWAVGEAEKKKKTDFSKAEFLVYEEGLCVQCMHIGPYDTEPATVSGMHAWIGQRGYVPDITDLRQHHEIYLSDPRRTAPEKRKTVIRHPIRKA